MIDWSALVLGPAMAAFSQPFTLTPTASQPGAPAYGARGVYASKPVQFALEDGNVHSTNQLELGIRLGDFAVAPEPDDTLTMTQGAFRIVDVNVDGQGGATLILRSIADD